MIATGVVTPFLVPMKVTALVAFMVALPYILFQAWAFVAPGLYEHEKRLAAPVIVASTVLFLVGVAFCYYFVFGKVFAFINEFAPKSITPAPDIEAYFGFVITMFLAFGITFEIPIVVMVLVRFGVVSVERLRDARPYVIVGAFVVAAVITPPDVLSQFMLAVPMCLLYEAGLFLSRFVGTRVEEITAAAESGVCGRRALPPKLQFIYLAFSGRKIHPARKGETY
jgi:sec-independent protein translocase protein TatC